MGGCVVALGGRQYGDMVLPGPSSMMVADKNARNSMDQAPGRMVGWRRACSSSLAGRWPGWLALSPLRSGWLASVCGPSVGCSYIEHRSARRRDAAGDYPIHLGKICKPASSQQIRTIVFPATVAIIARIIITRVEKDARQEKEQSGLAAPWLASCR